MLNILGLRLKELRTKNKVPQKKLIELLVLADERTYRRYESGEVDPPTSKLYKLAEFHSVSIDYLVGRTDNPEINK